MNFARQPGTVQPQRLPARDRKCEGAESEAEAIQRLVKGGIDGVIPRAAAIQESLKAVQDAGVTAILASGKPPGLSAISINNFEASRAMTRHLPGWAIAA